MKDLSLLPTVSKVYIAVTVTVKHTYVLHPLMAGEKEKCILKQYFW